MDPADIAALRELDRHDPMMATRLRAVLSGNGAGAAPLMPVVALEIHRLSMQADVTFDEIGRRANTDPSIGARLIAHASSALYGAMYGSGKPRGIKEALSRIGLAGVRYVAFDSAFSSRILRRGPHIELVERAIRHARTTSALCGLIARDTGCHPAAASLAGLLHGLGAVFLVDALADRAPRSQTGLILAIQRLHPWAAALQARHFHVADDVVEALAGHHHLTADASMLARVLALCDLLAPGEPGARAAPLEAALAVTGVPLAPGRVIDRLAPLLITVEEQRQARL